VLESSRKIHDLMKAQLCIYKKVESLLDKTESNKQGSVWAYKQVDEINLLFNKLRSLDEQINIIVNSHVEIKSNPELKTLADELYIVILNIKRHMGVLQARIKGGQQHVRSSIKSVLKNMEIKGYKKNMMIESGICIS